jgi:uncharacterized membrane protein YbaN (DUF454 family)
VATTPNGPLTTRILWLTVGLIALALGAIGVFLPLLPTTPFILVAAFAFMNSSQRLHDWLINHRIFGRLILEWREHGAISRPAKILAIGSMVAVLMVSVAFQAPNWVLAVQAPILAICAWFVGSRPLPPE